MAATFAREYPHDSRPRSSRWGLLVPAMVAAGGIAWTSWHYRDSLALPVATDSSVTTTSVPVASSGAIMLLKKMQQAYQQLESYGDRTQMTLRSRQGDQWMEDHAEMDVVWQRPDDLALRVVHGHRQFHVSVCEQTIQARIDDPQFVELADQLVSQRVSGRLDLAEVHRCLEVVDPQRPAVRNSALATLPAPLTLTPLALILDPQAVDGIIQEATGLELLPTSSLRGEPADRIRIETGQGVFVVWIAESSGLMRRIDLPVPSADPAGQQFSLTVDFSDIDIDRRRASSSFRFAASSQGRHVRHFVLPPPTRAPELLGSVVQGLEFTNVDGTRLASEIWEDHVAVLAWFNHHPSSRGVLMELEQFAASARNGCLILPVCTEPTTAMSHDEVSDLMRQWSLSLKPVRDLRAVGRDVLGIQRAPTVVVLDRQQRLQLFQEGADHHLDQQLMELLEKLSQDEDVANSQRMEIDRQWHDYERALAEATREESAQKRHQTNRR